MSLKSRRRLSDWHLVNWLSNAFNKVIHSLRLYKWHTYGSGDGRGFLNWKVLSNDVIIQVKFRCIWRPSLFLILKTIYYVRAIINYTIRLYVVDAHCIHDYEINYRCTKFPTRSRQTGNKIGKRLFMQTYMYLYTCNLLQSPWSTRVFRRSQLSWS